MVKITGRIKAKELQKRNERSRRVKTHGTKIGTAIVTVRGQVVTRSRCSIRVTRKGLIAVRNGIFVRPVSDSIINDKTFQGV